MTQVGPYTGAIVQMPPAKYKGEAHFVARGAALVHPRRRVGGRAAPAAAVLHAGAGHRRRTGVARTVLCEWQAGDHVKYADAPNPDASSFREAIQEKVNALQKREDEARVRG